VAHEEKWNKLTRVMRRVGAITPVSSFRAGVRPSGASKGRAECVSKKRIVVAISKHLYYRITGWLGAEIYIFFERCPFVGVLMHVLRRLDDRYIISYAAFRQH
jgi:hypothetical protein